MTAAMAEPKIETKAKVTPTYQLAPLRMKAADYERKVYVVTPENGHPFEALLAPEYWSHVAAKLRPYDMIEARAEDGSWFAWLLVQDAGPLHATVFPLQKWDIAPVEPSAAGALSFEAKWYGPHAKWGVIRTSDNKKMVDGLGTRGAAEEWLMNYRKSL